MYFEEFDMGQRFQCEPYLILADEIHEFAMKYDPHPIHVDHEFAEKRSIFNGVISSGFLTLSVMWGQWIRTEKMGEEFIVGKGFENVKFTAPVRQNDILTNEVEVVGLRPSSHPSRGEVTIKFNVTNQKGELVMLAEIKTLIKTKAAVTQKQKVAKG